MNMINIKNYMIYHFHLREHVASLLEKAMAPHSSTLAWKIPMDGGAWWAAVHGVAKSRHN